LVKIGYLPDQRLKINAALVPPNPKELDSAYSTEALRALLAHSPDRKLGQVFPD